MQSSPIQLIKGRGAQSLIQHRFANEARDRFDDGWDEVEADDAFAATLPPQTRVHFEDVKSALVKNDSPDLPFSVTLNPYRGCEHGCIYCFARPTHSYLGLSPGLDFETQIIAKRNIAEVLQHELLKPTYQPTVINVGGATDCYQPAERELGLTRQVIATLVKARHPFTLVTKSSCVERDIDLLQEAAALKLCAIFVTITTLDTKLARILEPRAAAPHRRLRVIETLAKANIPVGVSVSPQIPFINEDCELVLEAAKSAGASMAFYTVLRLPWEVAPLFREWLALHYPDRATRVMARVKDMRGGKDYDADFATRMKGSGTWAALIKTRFEKAMRRFGYTHPRVTFDLSGFDPQRLTEQTRLF